MESNPEAPYDYEAVLLRILPKASANRQWRVYPLVRRIHTEQAKLPPRQEFTIKSVDEIFGLRLDNYSQVLLNNYCPGYSGYFPIRVPADGNCLFNAISVVLCGNVNLATQLRVRTLNGCITF